MMQKTAEQLDSWKAQMKSYEKGKRTKKPFGNSIHKIQHVSYQDVKQNQVKFNPILQKFRQQGDQHIKTEKDEYNRARSLMNHVRQHHKYQRPYDIVNLHGVQDTSINQSSPKKLGPIRNAYNVINNQKLPDFHFKNRQMRLPVERQKNLLVNNQKQYNIVTNIYNEDHDYKAKQDQTQEKDFIYDKYFKKHDYDPVFGKFYDQQKEQQYQNVRKNKEKDHGKGYQKKFPPSYVYREAYIPDPTKPLPQSLQTLDERTMNAKKRYRLKYIIQDEYGRRNFEDEDKKEKVITNKVHCGRVEEQKSKQFDIITMKNYPKTRAQELYRKEITRSTWDQLNNTTNSNKVAIKTRGFN